MKPPGDAVLIKHLEVTPRKNEATDRMIKRFAKLVRDNGILKEVTHRAYFEKPSVIRRRKKEKAKWTARNNVRK